MHDIVLCHMVLYYYIIFIYRVESAEQGQRWYQHLGMLKGVSGDTQSPAGLYGDAIFNHKTHANAAHCLQSPC